MQLNFYLISFKRRFSTKVDMTGGGDEDPFKNQWKDSKSKIGEGSGINFLEWHNILKLKLKKTEQLLKILEYNSGSYKNKNKYNIYHNKYNSASILAEIRAIWNSIHKLNNELNEVYGRTSKRYEIKQKQIHIIINSIPKHDDDISNTFKRQQSLLNEARKRLNALSITVNVLQALEEEPQRQAQEEEELQEEELQEEEPQEEEPQEEEPQRQAQEEEELQEEEPQEEEPQRQAQEEEEPQEEEPQEEAPPRPRFFSFFDQINDTLKLMERYFNMFYKKVSDNKDIIMSVLTLFGTAIRSTYTYISGLGFNQQVLGLIVLFMVFITVYNIYNHRNSIYIKNNSLPMERSRIRTNIENLWQMFMEWLEWLNNNQENDNKKKK